MQAWDLSDVLSAVLPFVGNMGVLAASVKLILYRLDQIEKKQDKHNGLMERMAIAEQQIKVADHRIADLEEAKK